MKNVMMAAILMAGLTGVATAQMPAKKAAACELQAQAGTVAQLKAAKDAAARKLLLAGALSADPSAAVCLMQAIRAGAPELASESFNDIVAILGGDPANDDVVQSLSDDNADLVAENVDNVEPAAGDEGGTPPAGLGETVGSDETPADNESQFNNPVEEEPAPASPSSPAV